MDYLIELVELENKNKLKAHGLWNVVLEPGSKMEALYDMIHDGRVHSDEEAAIALYGADEGLQKYHSLKNKLKERLIDGLFLLHFKDPSYSDRQQAFFVCNKYWAAIQILMTRNAKLIGVDLLEKLLRQSLKFEFTELALNALRMLRLHYGSLQGDQQKYDQVNKQFRRLEEIWMRENRVEELYTQLIIRHIKDRSTQQDTAQLARQYYEEIQPWLQESDAFKLHLLGRLMQITIYSSANDYKTTASLCEDAIAFFKQKPYNSGLPLQVFYYQLITCYIHMRDFGQGKNLIRQVEDVFEAGTFNWFKLQELFFILAMHTGEYTQGLTVCNKVLLHANLKNQPDHVSETWRIYEAYIQYLVHIGIIPEADAGKKSRKFRLNKFLNDVPVYSRDKRGMNIPILILQILFLLSERKYDQCIDRIEAIEKYCSRYLKQNETFRSNVFIHMLLQLPLAAFHREGVSRKTEKLLNKLHEAPLELANQTHEIEIIPYEALWDMVVGNLERKLIAKPL